MRGLALLFFFLLSTMNLLASGEWTGKWIWDSGEESPVNYYLYVRKTFDLPSVPSTAPVKVCADSRYKLFVNGRYVGRGPVRSDPRWQYYDTYDLAAHLKTGKNVIAALVHHYGTGTFAYIQGRGAFLLDGYACCGTQRIQLCTDESWKVMPARAWFRELPRMDVQLGFNEVYDANKAPDNWTEVSYDDSAWANARVIGPVGIGPWKTLVLREIPHLCECEIFPVAVYEIGVADASGLTLPEDNKAPIAFIMSHEKKEGVLSPRELVLNPMSLCKRPTIDDLLKSTSFDCTARPQAYPGNKYKGVCTVKPPSTHKSTYMVLDFGREVTGCPRIRIRASKGGVVDIGYGELLINGKVDPNRAGVNYADRYIMKHGAQVWETFDKRAFRYMELDFRDCPGPVVIEAVSLVFSTYPVKWRGQFECSDSRLNKIWAVGAYTVQLNMEDAYTDCPWRERAQWWGDARVEAMTNYYAFGDLHLIRQGIRQIGQSQKEDGITACFWPGTYDNPIPAFSLYWVMSLWDYYLFSGDSAFVSEMFPKVQKLLEWFEAHEDEYNLLSDLPHWNFIDWTNTNLKGTVTAHNCLYYRALQDASALARAAGDPVSARRYYKKAKAIKEAINLRLFDQKRCVYPEYFSKQDNAFSEAISQMPNGLACAYGIASPDNREKILRKALDPSENMIPAGAFYAYYFLEALFENGLCREALDYIRSNYGKMLDAGATTLWEHWGNDNSLCHGWSSAPTSHLPKYVLGVCPIEPGFKRTRISPDPGDLDWARGTVPTPHGEIKTYWSKSQHRFTLTVEIPSGILAEVILPVNISGAVDVRINGSKILPSGVNASDLGLAKPTYLITKAGKYQFEVNI